MLRYTSYDIVFQEVPDEVTLAINLSNCPNRCKGCHSPHLQENNGKELTESVLSDLLTNYGNAITCVCFMGGDNSPENVLHLAKFVKQYPVETYNYTSLQQPYKTAWYSGNSKLHKNAHQYFDYIKLGEYVKELGGLNFRTSNQRFYRIENKKLIDITERFHKQ